MNKKRFFSVLLCLCLLCTIIPVTKASAVKNISAVSITVEEPAVGEQPSTAASVPDDASYYIKEIIQTNITKERQTPKMVCYPSSRQIK